VAQGQVFLTVVQFFFQSILCDRSDSKHVTTAAVLSWGLTLCRHLAQLTTKNGGWTIGVLGFDSRQGLGIFLFDTASRPALGPTQPPIQLVRGALSLRVKRPGHITEHSPPSSAEVKECGAIPPLHNTSSWLGA
jgi:hypothetical protein